MMFEIQFVSIPENGAIPFEGAKIVTSDFKQKKFQSPRMGQYPSKRTDYRHFQSLLLVSIPENGAIPFEG